MFLLAQSFLDWDLPSLVAYGTFWFWAFLTAEFIFLMYCLEFKRYYIAPFSLAVFLLVLFLFGDVVKPVLTYLWEHPLHTLGIIAGYFVVGTVYAIIKWLLFVRDVREINREYKSDWLEEIPDLISRYQKFIHNYEDAKRKGLDLSDYDISRELQNNLWNIPEFYSQTLNEQIYSRALKSLAALIEAAKTPGGFVNDATYQLWKDYESKATFVDFLNRSWPVKKPEPAAYKTDIINWIGWWPPSLVWTIINDPVRRIARQIYYSVARLLKQISDYTWQDEEWRAPDRQEEDVPKT